MSDLANLFRWKREVNIFSATGSSIATVYVKLVGDKDWQEARIKALKKSRSLRVRLRDTGSEVHEANFDGMYSMTIDELVTGIVFSEISDYRDAAVLEMGAELMPELMENPTLEDQEEHQEDTDQAKNDRIKLLTEKIEAKTEERREELKDTPREELEKMYISSLINMRCQEEFTNAFREWCIFKGTFSDKKYVKPAFDTWEEFENAAPPLKNQLLSAYTSLEISGEDLKN